MDFASQVFALPPPYKMIEAKVLEPPDGSNAKKKQRVHWVESPDGSAVRRLCYDKDGTLLRNAPVGSIACRPAPCKIAPEVRRTLEQHCYIQIVQHVDLAKYNYILTNNRVAFGDFMP